MDTKSTRTATELTDAPAPRTASDRLGVIGVIAGVLLLIGLVVAAVVVAAEERGVDPASVVNLRDDDGKGLQAGDVGPVTSNDVLAVLSAATDAAGGVPVSAETDGTKWLVELEQADGTEVTVRTQGDSVTVTESEQDDEPGQQTGLDRRNVEAAMAAAVAKVDGTVVAISADDDSIRDAYSVDVLTSGKSGVVEVELDRNFRVTHTESDPEEDTAPVDVS
jgi:hypothetical protein